jgi:Arabinose efflux permease
MKGDAYSNKGFQTNHSLIIIVTVILTMTFTMRASNNMFVTTIPLLSSHVFLFSNVTLGILVSLSSIATFISSTFLNAKLNSRSRRKALIISSIVYAIVFPLFYISTSITIWLILPTATFTLGIIMPNIITSASLFKDRRVRERILSIYTLVLSFSLIMGPLIESQILTHFSLEESFLFFSILPLVALVDAFFLKFPGDPKIVKRKGFDFSVLKNRGFSIALLNVLAYNLPFAFLTTYGGIYGHDIFGESYSLVNLTFSAFFASSFVSRLLFSMRVPEKLWTLMILAVILSSIGLAILGTASDYAFFLLAFIILGIPHGLTYPLSVMSITRNFGEEGRNGANSYFFSIMMLVGAAMPFISGEVIFLVGYRDGFLLLIPAIVVILLFLIRLIRIDSVKPGSFHV